MTPQSHHFGRRVRLEAVAPGGKRVPVWSDEDYFAVLSTQCGPVSLAVPVVVIGLPGATDEVMHRLKGYGYRNVTTEPEPLDVSREALRLACHLSDDPCEAP
jgi:hypothetical protein